MYESVRVLFRRRCDRTRELTWTKWRCIRRVGRARGRCRLDFGRQFLLLEYIPAGCSDDGGQHERYRPDHVRHSSAPARRLDDLVLVRVFTGPVRLAGISRLHRLQRGDVLLRTAVQLILPPVRRIVGPLILVVGDTAVAIRPCRGVGGRCWRSRAHHRRVHAGVPRSLRHDVAARSHPGDHRQRPSGQLRGDRPHAEPHIRARLRVHLPAAGSWRCMALAAASMGLCDRWHDGDHADD